MRILFISRKYPPYIGGSQTQLKSLAEELARDHQVTVGIISNGEGEPRSIDSLLVWLAGKLGRTTEDLECLASKGSTVNEKSPRVVQFNFTLGEKLRILARGSKARQLILGNKIAGLLEQADVVHCIKPDWVSLAARAATERSRLPFAITPYIHCRVAPDGGGELLRLMHESELVFYLTESDKEVLSDLGIGGHQLHHMGVAPLIALDGDGNRFRRRHGLADNPIVLYLGRMIKYKGAPQMIAARDEVWAVHPRAHFVFAGPGEATSLGVAFDQDPRLIMLGSLSEEEKADAIAACDIFCMPSRQEILPAVYLEAWTYRKPVIGGSAEGIDRLMDESGGGLVSDGDADCLARIINCLLTDAALRHRLGDAGHDYVIEKFALSVIGRRLVDAYQQAIGRPRSNGTDTKHNSRQGSY